MTVPRPLPDSVDATIALLAAGDYIADRSLGTALFLSLRLGRPLFLEGEAGVGKTEVAKVLARTLERRLIRLQCYEGLDLASAAYEWNYARQMLDRYSTAHRLYRNGPDGERIYLSDAELAAARTKAESDVATWCD